MQLHAWQIQNLIKKFYQHIIDFPCHYFMEKKTEKPRKK